MKRTLIITGITSLALAAGAMAEDQNHKGRVQGKGANRATAATSARTSTGANARARQFTAHQNKQNRQVTTHQNNSTRAFHRQAAIKSQTSTQANVGTNRVTTRERNLRRAQTTTSNAVVNNTTGGRVTRQQALRDQRAQQRVINGTTTNSDLAINRTRNVNRNVTVVNNWRSAQFSGQRYSAFRDYHRAWHDRGWWDTNYGTSLTFVFGAPYFWNAGYWYPAWGYNPGYVYPYDGPIYGGANLTPDQIVMNVQVQLRDDGYYGGPVDGVLGPRTRYALAQFQADHGLAVTSAVDEPTLATLGLA